MLGRSGCGKTTLISCIMGIHKVNDGDLYVFGENPGLNKVKMIGYMPQVSVKTIRGLQLKQF